MLPRGNNIFLILFLFPFVAIIFYSCTGNRQKKETPSDSIAVQKEINPFEKNGIRLTEVENSTEFSDAKIEIVKPRNGDYIKAGKVKFEFNIENFQTGNQTEDAKEKSCLNSAEGQHIMFVLNNETYSALYEPKIEVELDEGQYTLLAFLSRSYHESIKSKNAFAITQFIVGRPESIDTLITEDYETGELFKTEIAYFTNGKKQQINLKLNSNPYLFYNRPSGTYYGADTKKILLDFFLLNDDLSENGNKVRLLVDSSEFIITKWSPYFIEGLSMGEHKISLSLIDNDNNPVFYAAPFYESGERIIYLKEDNAATAKN